MRDDLTMRLEAALAPSGSPLRGAPQAGEASLPPHPPSARVGAAGRSSVALRLRRLAVLLVALAVAVDALPAGVARADDDEGSAEVDAAVAKALYEQGVKLYHAGK